MSGHEEKLALARALVRKQAPYFSSVLYGLTFVPVEEIPTMAVTKGLVCGYNPTFVEQLPLRELAAAVAHEIQHVVRGHFKRGENVADPALFNIATDFAINPDLRRAGWELPKIAIFPEQRKLPEGKTAEEYYQLLLQQKNAAPPPPGKSGKPAPGNSPGSPTESHEGQSHAGGDDPPDDPADGGEPPGQDPGSPAGQGDHAEGEPPPGVGGGSCGRIGGHATNPGLEDSLDAEAGRSEVEKKRIDKQLAHDIQQHAAQHGRGSLPADLIEWAAHSDDPPAVRWQDELANILRNCTGRVQSGGDDFSLSRPSKRSYMRGMVRPGMVEHLPDMAFVLDTSGSMGDAQLKAAVREAVGIIRTLGIDEVWFAEADAAVAMDFKLVNLTFFKNMAFHGRGGTDFRPAFAAARKLQPSPNILVYFTDGDGEAPQEPPPNMETVWCIVPSYYRRPPAKWGHTVMVSDLTGEALKNVW